MKRREGNVSTEGNVSSDRQLDSVCFGRKGVDLYAEQTRVGKGRGC